MLTIVKPCTLTKMPIFVLFRRQGQMSARKIIHVDMDQFFAAVEQRDQPQLRGKPIAVGYDAPRGIVATASYEARPYGVHSALSIQIAKKRCPQLIIVEPHFQKYKEVSVRIRSIFHEYTDLIEPISLDEAFLDVTENKPGIPLAVDIAKEIKQRIEEETGLTASAGVSYCKFLAKIASDYRKPNGLCVIHPQQAQAFIDKLEVTRFWGVGKKTAERMHKMGIYTGNDLRNVPLGILTQSFGKAGHIFYNFARGIDKRPVVSEWIRKSVSCEQTFERDTSNANELADALQKSIDELLRRLEKNNFEGYTLTLKIKFHDFRQITRSITSNHILQTREEIEPLANQLMAEVDYDQHPIRLMGLGVSNHHDTAPDTLLQPIQLELPFDYDDIYDVTQSPQSHS